MIEEQYVSFETAKLAKEKGFDEEFENMHVWNNFKGEILEDVSGYNMKNSHLCKNSYSAPTQSLLARWLREKHHIHVIPFPNGCDNNGKSIYGCNIWYVDINGTEFGVHFPCYPIYIHGNNSSRKRVSYEEAMEAGLQVALNLLSNI